VTPRSVILEVGARTLYWLIVATSAWVLLRGHNQPGGGFIGGLMAVSATVVLAAAFGTREAAARLPLGAPLRLLAAGVLLAAVSGLPATLLGKPYLTHLWRTLPLGFADLKVSTVMLFDLGVYLAVWGALAGYALALIDPDAPEHRQ